MPQFAPGGKNAGIWINVKINYLIGRQFYKKKKFSWYFGRGFNVDKPVRLAPGSLEYTEILAYLFEIQL